MPSLPKRKVGIIACSGEETLYTQAVALAWQSYCAGKEQAHG